MNRSFKIKRLLKAQDCVRSIWAFEEYLELKKALKAIDKTMTKALNILGDMEDPKDWKTDKKKEESANFPLRIS